MVKTSWYPAAEAELSREGDSAVRRLPTLDERILVLAPFARDAQVIQQVLSPERLTVEVVAGLEELSRSALSGAGALLLTEEALTRDGIDQLRCLLSRQPTWSDLPIVLLLSHAERRGRADAIEYWRGLTSSPSVTILRRPVPSVTLLTSMKSALRSRRRQYEVRDLIAREQAAREQAEAAGRVKDEFLASVSHELRTPLSAIMIWSKLMAGGRLDPEQTKTAIQAVVSGAEAQSRLIEDLLDVTRMLAGKLRLDTDPYPLAPIVFAAADVVRPMGEAKGVRLELHLAESATLVLGDPHRLQQVFWNLLSNAVKFSDPGGCVTLSVAEEPEWIEIRVSDVGAGIEPELLSRVFERFWQSPQAGGTRSQLGLGLGLSIVRQLIELHGGTVSAVSDGKGRGSTFIVRLPSPP